MCVYIYIYIYIIHTYIHTPGERRWPRALWRRPRARRRRSRRPPVRLDSVFVFVAQDRIPCEQRCVGIPLVSAKGANARLALLVFIVRAKPARLN